jgi:hypothetical protein
MSSNPYENEPGFETANDALDKKNQKEYVRKVSERVGRAPFRNGPPFQR